jgi:hypothetical protein
MTLSQNMNLNYWGEVETETWICDSSSAQHIYRGMAMIIDANVDTLYARIADGVTALDGDVLLGIADGEVSIASGDAEDSKHQVELLVGPSIVGFPSSDVTNADVGKTIYAAAYTSTGITLSTSNGAYPALGTLHRVENGYAYIQLPVTPFVLDVA